MSHNFTLHTCLNFAASLHYSFFTGTTINCSGESKIYQTKQLPCSDWPTTTKPTT